MNVPAVLGLFKVLRDPSIILPHCTVPTFNHLPVPLSGAFEQLGTEKRPRDIRAIVLDKDNCFAVPNTNNVFPEYTEKFRQLIEFYKPTNVLIVSNSSGLHSSDPDGNAAKMLEQATGVKVLRHETRKPGCGAEIMAYFGDRVTSPSQIAVVGDRLFTDTLLANTMGAHAVWIRRGVIPDQGIVTRLEYGLSSFLLRHGFRARTPRDPEQP